jgi:hypothetical protein
LVRVPEKTTNSLKEKSRWMMGKKDNEKVYSIRIL